jgi:hypothetical protein
LKPTHDVPLLKDSINYNWRPFMKGDAAPEQVVTAEQVFDAPEL